MSILYLVHCVDTEGPLFESLGATSKRIRNTFGINVKLDKESLKQLQQGIGVPEELRQGVMDFLHPERLKYNSTWSEIDDMLDEVMDNPWRNKYMDDFSNGYIFNWFVLDHVGFSVNPRRRSMGYHVIYDHYKDKIREYSSKDKIYWHYHPTPFFFEANKTSNNFSYSNEHLQVLSRRVIDYMDFPVVYRPGAHTERPDINLFLEQWIPFDFGNQGMPERDEDRRQKDVAGGRFGDWRRATSEWEVYHPDFYDYQKKGGMKRYIARCLNLGSRLRPITRDEVEKAFVRAQSKPTILSITNHDEREFRNDIDWYMNIIYEMKHRFSDVKICHANALDAIRKTQNLEPEEPTLFDIYWIDNQINIVADKSIWGPQPYFCFKTHDCKYIHENLDYQGESHWSYVFDDDTIKLASIEKIGLATNDNYGNSSNYVVDVKTRKIKYNLVV